LTARRLRTHNLRMGSDRMHFVPAASIEKKVLAAFSRHRDALQLLLPQAEVHHIGSTSIAGSLTKGDLDILVRVSAGEFESAEQILSGAYARNTGSIRTDTFASFKDDAEDPPLGVQLAVAGSEFDDFLIFRDIVTSQPGLLGEYNQLKQHAEGTGEDDYRRSKDAFIERILATARARS
jgi:GrpB-like predicted nucleotidyltransferase (UPF0157 family)